jgi:hypothetical protein
MPHPLPSLLLRTASVVMALAFLPTASEAQFGHSPWQPRPWQVMPTAQLTLAHVGQDVPSHGHPLLLVAGGLAGYAVTRSLFAMTERLAQGHGNCRPGLCLSGVAVVAAALAVPSVSIWPTGAGETSARMCSPRRVGLGVLLIGARSGVSAEGLLVAVPVGQILAAVAAEIIVSRRPRSLPEP